MQCVTCKLQKPWLYLWVCGFVGLWVLNVCPTAPTAWANIPRAGTTVVDSPDLIVKTY